MAEGQRLDFHDPADDRPFAFEIVPSEKLSVISHQRKARPTHVDRLVESIRKIGFVVPLVVVEGGPGYLVIDGQHRLKAGKKVGIDRFPVIVVPSEIARRMMSLNVEKDLNIRERCVVALSLYREVLGSASETLETDGAIVDAVEQPHYISLGLAYESAARLAGSSFEPILKRCDAFLEEPLERAYEIRKSRAESILEAAELIKSISERLKEMGAWHQFVTQQILSYANPLKRKRAPVAFEEVFAKLIEKLEAARDEPEKVLGASYS